MSILNITDFDGTVVPIPQEIRKGADATPYLAAYAGFMAAHPEIRIAYCSGRSVKDLMGRLRAYENLPEPAFLIGSNGGEIYDFAGKSFVKEWENAILATGFSWDKVAKALENVLPGRLEMQDDLAQSFAKACFNIDTPTEAEKSLILAALEDAGVKANTYFINSYYVDVIPQGIHKGAAVRFMMEHTATPKENTVICGDATNDFEMFEADVALKIAPSNAEPELLERIKGLENVYVAEREISFGVIEGFEKFLSGR